MQSTEKKLINFISGKNVLFITHKGINYIRNNQEIKIINKRCKSIKILSAGAQLTWWNYIFSIIKIFVSAIFCNKKNIDMIFFGYLPQLLLPFSYLFFKNKIIIIDFFISLYDTIIFDKQLISKQNPLAKFIKYIDRITLEKADHIIADTKTHREYFKHEFNFHKDNIYVLYLDADKQIYYPHKVKRPAELKNKYLIIYFGTILPLQGAEIILESIYALRNKKNIHFIFIGPFKKKLLKNYSNLKNITFISWINQELLSDYIAMSDLCLAGHFNDKISKASRVIPGKAYIYDAMKKRIILGENKANKEIFKSSNKRYHYVKMGDPIKLSKKISELYKKRNK